MVLFLDARGGIRIIIRKGGISDRMFILWEGQEINFCLNNSN